MKDPHSIGVTEIKALTQPTTHQSVTQTLLLFPFKFVPHFPLEKWKVTSVTIKGHKANRDREFVEL